MSRLCSSQRKYTIVAAKKLHGKEIVPWPIDRSAKQWVPFSVVSPGFYTHVLQLTGNCGCMERGETCLTCSSQGMAEVWARQRVWKSKENKKEILYWNISSIFGSYQWGVVVSSTALTDDESRSFLKTQVTYYKLAVWLLLFIWNLKQTWKFPKDYLLIQHKIIWTDLMIHNCWKVSLIYFAVTCRSCAYLSISVHLCN